MSLRRITSVGLVACFLGAGLTACGSDDPAGDAPAEGTLLVTNDNSFTSEADLHLGDTVVTAASGHDVEVCWDIDKDLQCHDAPAIKTLFLFRVAQPDRDEVIKLILSGEFKANVDATLRYEGANKDDDGCVSLADFKAGSTAIEIDDEYFESSAYSYVLVFSSETGVGTGTVSMMFLEPSSGGDGEVTAPSGCEQLEYSVDLHSLTPLDVPMEGPWPIDWRDLKRTGDGGSVPYASIDRVLLAFYEGLTVKDLEDNIFDLEQLDGAEYWEIEHDGTQRDTDLALAKDSDGKAFPGFDNGKEGTWLMGLMCGTCTSPAPIMLTILNPTE